MSAPLNLLVPDYPFAAFTFDDNVVCQQLNIQAQQGVGVVSGMELSAGSGAVLNIATGVVQNPRTVTYPGGAYTIPSNGSWYVVADWVAGTPDPMTGLSAYTFTFNIQSGPTPPGGQVCLGFVTVTGGTISSVSTHGLVMLPHMSGSQWIAGQDRMVIDDSTGVSTVQNLQGNVAIKNVLQSGDNAIIDGGYQMLVFGSFMVPTGATFTCNGQFRVIS